LGRLCLQQLKPDGYDVPAALLGRDVTGPIEPCPAMQAILIAICRSSRPALRVCERLVDLDESVQEWRYRHVQMVQRTIGMKPGTTGGWSGARDLQTASGKAAFPDCRGSVRR
jgi:tryptophan 2,3-dioxygenase